MNKLIHSLNGNINSRIAFGSLSYNADIDYPVIECHDFISFIDIWDMKFYYSKGRKFDEILMNCKDVPDFVLDYYRGFELPDRYKKYKYKLNYLRNNKMFLSYDDRVLKALNKHERLTKKLSMSEKLESDESLMDVGYELATKAMDGIFKKDLDLYGVRSEMMGDVLKIIELENDKVLKTVGDLNDEIQKIKQSQFDIKKDFQKTFNFVNVVRGYYSKVFNVVIPELTLENVYELREYSNKMGVNFPSYMSENEELLDSIAESKMKRMTEQNLKLKAELENNIKESRLVLDEFSNLKKMMSVMEEKIQQLSTKHQNISDNNKSDPIMSPREVKDPVPAVVEVKEEEKSDVKSKSDPKTIKNPSKPVTEIIRMNEIKTQAHLEHLGDCVMQASIFYLKDVNRKIKVGVVTKESLLRIVNQRPKFMTTYFAIQKGLGTPVENMVKAVELMIKLGLNAVDVTKPIFLMMEYDNHVVEFVI